MDIIGSLRKRLRPSSRPRIQVLSDLHLEVGQQYASYAFPASAPLLLLAGDIGRLVDYEGYLHFLDAQVSRYRKVFLVLGNHEFYGLDYDAGVKEAQRLAAKPSVSQRSPAFPQAWSSYTEREDIYDLVKSKISDCKKINDWTPQRHNEVHAEEVAWLRAEAAHLTSGNEDGKDRQLLVATHHAPCVEGTSRPEHCANPWTPAFATDLIQEKAWTRVNTWVFGHTHYSTDFRRDGIRLVANQRGYVLPGSEALKNEGKVRRSSHEFDATRFITMSEAS